MLAVAGHARSEVDVGQHRHAGLVQQPLAQLLRIGGTDQRAGLGDVGPSVERAARRRATEARHLVEQPHDQVAPGAEALAHRVGLVLRTVERLHGRPLTDLGRATLGIGDPAREHRRQRAIGREADAPAGHRIGLRGTIGNDGALAHAGQRGNRRELAVVDELAVDLVGVHPDLLVAAQHVGDRFQIGAGQQTAGWIVRRVEDQQPGLRRDARSQFIRIEREAARLAQRQADRHRAIGQALRLVDRESRHREDHLVAGAMIGDARNCVGNERLGACADNDLVGRDVEPAQAAHRRGGRRPQLVDAGRRRVAVLAAANRGDRRILDVGRRREVWLADAERDHVLAGTDQRVDLGQNDECVFGAEAGGTLGQGWHGLLGRSNPACAGEPQKAPRLTRILSSCPKSPTHAAQRPPTQGATPGAGISNTCRR